MELGRHPCSNAGEYDSRTVVQPCIWFKEEPSQFSMGQTAQSLTCSIVEKPQTGFDECPRILLSCFRARNSVCAPLDRTSADSAEASQNSQKVQISNLRRIETDDAIAATVRLI